MKVLLLGNIVNDGSISMHVYLKDLIKNIKNVDFIHPKTNLPKFIFKNFIYPFRVRKKADVYHIIDHSYSHLVHFLPKNKTIVTCHDLIPLKLKKAWTISSILTFRYYISGLKKAKYILSISESTKKDLIELLGISKEKIIVIPYGVDLSLFYKKDKNQIKERMGWKNKIVLMNVGGAYYKNTLRILKSVNKIKKKYKNIILLKIGDFLKNENKYIEDNNLRKYIFQKKNMSQDELSDLYNASDMLIFPSLYEGFGRPPLEAMACGTPVIVSNVSSLPEVVGEGGIQVNPHSQDEIDSAVLKLIEDNKLRNQLIKNGFKNIKRFSWKEHAKRVKAVYEKIKI